MRFTLSEIFSTNNFKVYGIGEEDIFRMSNEDPNNLFSYANSVPSWIKRTLLLEEAKNIKVREQKKNYNNTYPPPSKYNMLKRYRKFNTNLL